MYNSVNSGEAEIQTSSHSSRSKVDVVPDDVNKGALKIIEDLNGSELDVKMSPRDIRNLQMKEAKVKQIYTNIVANNSRKKENDSNNWRKLTITTGEFVYPQVGTAVVLNHTISNAAEILEFQKKTQTNRSLIYRQPKSKSVLKKTQFNHTQGAIPFKGHQRSESQAS